jgi:glycosyltransferase involved in cell wall biosynthesis
MRADYIHSGNIEVPSANTLQVARMCEAFAHAGADITLWYPHYRSASAVGDWRAHYGVGSTFDARMVPVVLTERLFATPALPVLKMLGYVQMLRRDVDLIYTRCFAAAAFFPRALRWKKTRPKIIFEAHELPPSRARGRALRGVDGIVAITAAASNDIARELGVPHERMFVAPDGVPAQWVGHPIPRATARDSLRLPTDRHIAVYTGRFHDGTAELLSKIAATIDVVAVGMGADAARARVGTVRGLTIYDPVSADAVRLYQAAADVLLMPHAGQLRWSRYTSPLKLFEYMAAERPIVASHLPVLDEVVRHGETAWLVPVGDAEGMVRGVKTVLNDPLLAARLVSNARREVTRYTWDARAKTILDFARALR